MKNKKRILKIIGASLEITTLLCIIPTCVVSCGSSSSSSESSDSYNNNSQSQILGTTITGNNYANALENWTTSFNQMTQSNQYPNWMKSNLNYYCQNAPTYFQNIAEQYYRQFPQTLSSNQNDENNQLTTNNYNDYLPCTYDIDESDVGGGEGAPVLCLELQNMTLNSCVYNPTNNSFNIEITETYNSTFFINNVAYDDEGDESNNMMSNTVEYTDTITNAIFSPTLLTNSNTFLPN